MLQTITVLTSAILGLLLYPETQKKAQAELDRVIGRNKSPEIRDLKSLPYINAIVKESMRWKPAVPVGIPHRLMEDDVFDGMFIPSGSVVIGNAWFVYFYRNSRTDFDKIREGQC